MPEERDYESAVSDAARRAHDQELEMLANIAIIRSTFASRNKIRQEKGSNAVPTPEELNQRLRSIVEDLEHPSAEKK